MSAAALSPHSLAQALQGALQQSEQRSVCEQALTAWEACLNFPTSLLQLASTPPVGLGQPERLLAVLCLKNAVTRRWHQRRQDEPMYPDAEKSAVRDGLLTMLNEPDAQIWAQVELVIAVIGRLDGLQAWPALMPTLLETASQPAPHAAARGLCALYRVVKQQASRRLLVHRKQFFALAEELLPRLQPLRMAHASQLLTTLSQSSLAEVAGWLTRPAASGDSGAATLLAARALCKLERQLLMNGWAHLHQHPEPCAVLGHYLEILVASEAQQRRLREAAADGVAGAAEAAAALMPLLLIPVKMLMEVQDHQPLAMTTTLPHAITFVLGQLNTRPFTPGAADDDEKFLVRALMFMRNALSTSAYLPTRQAPPQAHACQQVLHAFFASPSLPQLVTSLLTRALPLTAAEYEGACLRTHARRRPWMLTARLRWSSACRGVLPSARTHAC